jgi:hypothetical protein
MLGFVPTKVVGYYAAGRYLRYEHPKISFTPARIAASRVMLGACVDAVVGGIAFKVALHNGRWTAPLSIAYVTLIGLRAFEWKFVIRRAMGPGYMTRAISARLPRLIVLGTLWSSFLDPVGGLAMWAVTNGVVRLFIEK